MRAFTLSRNEAIERAKLEAAKKALRKVFHRDEAA
jgi:hypothetical protein